MMRTKKRLLNGKKGNAFLDSLTVVIVIFIFGVITIFGYQILTEINADFQSSDLSNGTKESVNTLTNNYPSFMDLIFLTAFVLLWISAIIFSFLVDTHPIFLVITLVLLLLVLFFGSILTNTYEEISTEEDFPNNSFPITNFILSNLVLVVIFIGFSIVIALYGKSRIG